MTEWVDQTGRCVVLNGVPVRVLSLVPSQTELLIDLGVQVIGRTKFCIHPAEKVAHIPIVGGTKQIDYERIHALNPDLIIGNKEENTQEIVETLASSFPVYLTDVRTLEDALEMIGLSGSLLDREREAQTLQSEIARRFAKIESVGKKRVAYFIWRKPWMVVGGDTFIDDMLRRIGVENIFAKGRESRYPTVTVDEIRAARPDVLLFSSEPYPFQQARFRAELEAQLAEAQSIVVDGELFSWYGSRLLKSADYLSQLASQL